MLVSQHNPALTDIAQALSNSLDRNGSGGMRANLDMGLFRVVNAAAGVNSSDLATVGQVQSISTIPVGVVLDYWGAAPPDDYLFAAGQAISRSTYAELFAVLGTVAGAGDGSTTFNLPDYRSVVSAGKADMGGVANALLSNYASSTLAAIFGSQSHTLTSDQMPSHNHAITDPGHTHLYSREELGLPSFANAGGNLTQATASTVSALTGITLASTGGGQAHPNVQPTIICNKIIKVRSS